jgi:hypothetical protein
MAMIVEIPNKRIILKIIARIIPINLALGCSSRDNLLEAIVMNIILSIPRTISKKVSVNKLIQTAGLEKSGKIKEARSII